eukprot:289105-Amphidinium_carterae.1
MGAPSLATVSDSRPLTHRVLGLSSPCHTRCSRAVFPLASLGSLSPNSLHGQVGHSTSVPLQSCCLPRIPDSSSASMREQLPTRGA